MTRTTPSPHRRGRRGFTLVELLIVIVIISVLMALLIPVIAAAVRKTNDARVVAEINTLATALETFKGKYGDYPPSRIMLSEYQGIDTSQYNSTLASFTGWRAGTNLNPGTPDITVGLLYERSMRFMRKFFPKAVFPPPNYSPGSAPLAWNDYNGNGQPDPGFIYLEGHECLVFFLGGIPLNDGQSFSMSGFDKNPARRFTSPSLNAPTAMRSDNREAPFHEFNGSRLIDNDGDGIPGYVDTMNTGSNSRYLAYFSAYGNNGYDPNDENGEINPETNDLGNLVGRTFRVNVGTGNGPVASPAPNPYTTNDPLSANRARFEKPNSFQILSAGGDGFYGPGGLYASGGDDRLPADAIATTDDRLPEKDNLTNFASTRLD